MVDCRVLDQTLEQVDVGAHIDALDNRFSVFRGERDLLFTYDPDGESFPITVSLFKQLEEQCIEEGAHTAS